MTTPYLDLVPKDPLENLKWRERWWSAARTDTNIQDAFRQAAYEDVLFFFNAFMWCYEPRFIDKRQPFVTWPHQDPAILAMDQAITDAEYGSEPTGVILDKSRAQGGTVTYLGVFIRRWLRDPDFTAGLVTRNENLVDSATNSDALMFKVAWMIDRLPYWMLPAGFNIEQHRSLSDHVITNPEKGGTIVGHSATGDAGRGGRRTVWGIDELGAEDFIKGGKDYSVLNAVRMNTNCIFLVSTFGADSGAFWDACNDPGNARKLILDWRDNPTQNKLAYRVRNGQATAVRPEEALAFFKLRQSAAFSETWRKLERRGFNLEGTVRSPWYDAQCLAFGATPRSIARELDRNPRGAVGKVFPSEVLNEMKESYVRRPAWQGKPVVDSEKAILTGLLPQAGGPLKLWFLPSLDNKPPSGTYALGCDIAVGTGGEYSSNSVISGINYVTGEQVLEFAVNTINPTRLACIAVALARWLKNAYLNWETTGPTGETFGLAVMRDIRYSNVWMRLVTDPLTEKKTRKPGWRNSSDKDKADLFERLALGMESREFVPRSEDLIRECNEYEWEKGKIIHKPSKQHKEDGAQHGDRAVAAGVMWLAAKERIGNIIDIDGENRHNIPVGSIAWFDLREKRMQHEFDDDHEPFCINDLMRSEAV